MEFVDITELSVKLFLVSGITKVLVDLMKSNLVIVKENSQIKSLLSLLIAVIITSFTSISLFTATTGVALYLGVVAAGLIAGLGSNFIHEIMQVLQTVKSLKEKK